MAGHSVAVEHQAGGDMLSRADHEKIGAAIEGVEKKTCGDIYCIVAHEASNYREVPLAWASFLALVVPILVLAAGMKVFPFLKDLEGWSAVPARDLSHWILVWGLLQAFLFSLVGLTVSIPPVRRLLTPHFLKRHRVGALARQHFISTGLHLESYQPHVVIFVSLAERIVEVLADPAIHKLAGETVWHQARDAVVTGMRAPDPSQGLVRAIEIAGAPLIEHFPASRPMQHRDGVAEV